jgi:thiamine kinase-like enzyme
MLEPSKVVSYLLERGMVSPAGVVSGDVRIDIVQRKNVSFRVQTSDACYILKRTRIPADSSITAENEVYRRITRLDSQFGLDYLPGYFGYDTDAQILVLEYLPHALTLRDYHQRTARAARRIGTQVARALITLHGNFSEQEAKQSGNQQIPFAMQLLRPPIDILASESAGTIELIRTLQSTDVFQEVIERVRGQWTVNAFCHNDIRLDNILYDSRRALSSEISRVKLIDWELAEPGWSLWDVASFLASYMELWAVSALRTPTSKASRTSVTHFHPILQEFWREYVSASINESDIDERERIACLVSVRLLQTAIENSQQSIHVTRESLALLSLARRIATYPIESWVHLFGLPLTSERGAIAMDRSEVQHVSPA